MSVWIRVLTRAMEVGDGAGAQDENSSIVGATGCVGLLKKMLVAVQGGGQLGQGWREKTQPLDQAAGGMANLDVRACCAPPGRWLSLLPGSTFVSSVDKPCL